MTVALALAQTADAAATVLASLVGLAVLAAILAGTVAVAYRWYVRERLPGGLGLLVALSGVAVVLNTTRLLSAEIANGSDALVVVDALFNIAAFVCGAAGALAGVRAGDRVGTAVFAAGVAGNVDADVSEIVQTVGRVTRVQLPDQVDDIVGYDPVDDATRESLAGRQFFFPRRLTRDELRERLVSRLKTDYGVGHVDVEIGQDGGVDYLAVGSRAAGIGPTLPPATSAVAIRADPAHAAGAGDLVQVWETDPVGRVLTGELRGVAGDVVTVAIDSADTPKLDPTERYKLVTLPVQDRPDREFASLLRAADETLATVTVEAGSDLEGTVVGEVTATVAAITREDEPPVPLPSRGRVLRAGDVVYAIATPAVLRKVEAAGRAPHVDGTAADAPETRDRGGRVGTRSESDGGAFDHGEPADVESARVDSGSIDGGGAGDAGTDDDTERDGDAAPRLDRAGGPEEETDASETGDDDRSNGERRS